MKNTIENIIIALVVFIIGSFSGGFIGYKAAVNAIGTQKDLIITAIEKETSKIQNSFETSIKKFKNKKGNTDFTVEPEIENNLEQQTKYYKKRNRKLFGFGRRGK